MLGPIEVDHPAAARIARIARAAFRDGGRGWSAAEVRAFAAHPGALVIADVSQAAGAILLRVVEAEAEIIDFGVVPAMRRSGFGRALLAAAEAEAARRGARSMILEVAEDSDAAGTLYRSAGYAAVGRRPRYYRRADGSRVDGLILVRALSAGRACPPGREGLEGGEGETTTSPDGAGDE